VRRSAAIGTVLILAVTAVVTLAGAVQKAPCANRSWVEERRGTSTQCYSDVGDLYLTEQLTGGRVPYLEPCAPAAKPCDEYPVGSMAVMRGTAWLSDGLAGDGDPYTFFYWTNVALLLACALATAWLLERAGAATILFAAAPTLAMYGTMNWDLVAVALATAATVCFLRRRDGWAGLLLGAGAAVKIFPALLLVPFVIERGRERDRTGAVRLATFAAGTWLALNLPLAVAAPHGWWTFFRYNADRPAEYDTVWRALCWAGPCVPTWLVGLLSLAIPIVGTALVWRWKTRREPDTPRWVFAFPLLVLFVLGNKVWSPQYGLWLLPWFALVAPSMKPFLAWQATEVLVFVVRFSYFDAPNGDGGVSYSLFAAAIALRALALVWALAVWTRAPTAQRLPAGLGSEPVPT
jgi:hypothetical protein